MLNFAAIMISIENLKVEFGATPLFQGVSYIINPKDRIALVGKNGAGKSTTMDILTGYQLTIGTMKKTDTFISIAEKVDTR